MNQVALDIIEQMGGNKFFAMTGCKAVAGEDYVRFTIPRNASSANRLDVTYNEGLDLYDVRFYRRTGGNFNMKTCEFRPVKEKTIAEFTGAYCDMLQALFTEVTGMDTHL